MPFGDISTFYFVPELECFDQPWGLRVRNLQDTASANSGSDTICRHPSNQTTSRTVRPYITSTAGGSNDAYGWAVRTTDMGSVAGALRAIRAGVHTLTVHIERQVVGGNGTFVNFRAYRVAASDAPTPYERTLLGQVSPTINNLGGTISLNLTLPEIVFQPGETIQYGATMQTTAGLLQVNFPWVLGTSGPLQGSVVSRVDHPGLITIAPTRGSSAGAATASALAANALGTRGASQGASAVAGELQATAGLIGSASGIALPQGALAGMATQRGLAAGSAQAEGELAGAAAMVGASEGSAETDGVLAGTAAQVGSSAGSSEAHGELAGTGGLVGSAEGDSDASGTVGAVAGMVGEAEGDAAVLAQLAALRGTVGTSLVGEGGGEAINNYYPTNVFDD